MERRSSPQQAPEHERRRVEPRDPDDVEADMAEDLAAQEKERAAESEKSDQDRPDDEDERLREQMSRSSE